MVVVTPPPPPAIVETIAEVIAGGVECPLIRAENGKVYSLTHVEGPLTVGERIFIRATPQRFSFCMQGPTLRIESLDHLGEPDATDRPQPRPRVR